MNRHNHLLNQIQESIEAAQKTYKGQKRSDLKDSDFLFPETRSLPITANDSMEDEEENSEDSSTKLMEYKQDFLSMNIGSLKAIMQHASSILKSVEENNGLVKNNLTESWLQGKIAITEDYMRTIHDFVKYVPSDDDKTIAGCGCGKKKPKPTNEPAQPAQPQQPKLEIQKDTKGHTHQAKPT